MGERVERRIGKGEYKEQREGEGKSYFHLQYIVYCSIRRNTHFLRSTPGAGAAHMVRVAVEPNTLLGCSLGVLES